MARLFKKRKEKKQAEEAARKQSIQDLKLKNQAKRDKKAKDMAALAEAKKSKSPGSVSAAPSRVTVGSKTYTSQAAADAAKFRETEKQKQVATKRGSSNIKARSSVEIGETYERTNPDGTKRKMIKRDQSKPSQQNNQPKPTTQTSSSNNSEFSKTFSEERKKQGAGGKFAFKGKSYTTNLKEEESNMAKHGGALAIMIAPVKTKNKKTVKAIKKGAKAQNGGKVGDPKKKKSVVTVDQDLKDLGNALKEGVKMITIPGYGAMKLSQYLAKRKKGMSKTEIGKSMKSAGKEGGAEAVQEMAKMGTMKTMNRAKAPQKEGRPMMKKTMTKLIKKKDTRPYSKRPRPDHIPQTVRDKKKMENGGKVGDPKMKNGGRLLKKSKSLQEKDRKLQSKVTEVYKEGGYENNKKAERIQNKRMRVQKREHKAFTKGFKKKLASEKK